jgi:antitoxin component of MazEF toxin-antitoxin module
MFTIKLQQQGDTLNMTIPPETIERLGLHAGQELTLTERVAGFEIVTREARVARQLALADEVLREQADALKALADL